MNWFKRIKDGITTSTDEKKETPDGLWVKCSNCNNIITSEEHIAALYCCLKCNAHSRIGSNEYFKILFDNNKFIEINNNIKPEDPLSFEDKKKYIDRLKDMQNKTGLNDAIRTAHGKLKGKEVSYLVDKLKTYRAGTKIGPNSDLMIMMAQPLSDVEIANLAAYLNAQK